MWAAGVAILFLLRCEETVSPAILVVIDPFTEKALAQRPKTSQNYDTFVPRSRKVFPCPAHFFYCGQLYLFSGEET